ncbi:unnamed protein product (macronuclear) [Paramecium tetraurelia]|uniref:RING-type domain-containing protein n=1 Tax=Paramecium tetraurelia TaxID=5888 RepID=A0D7D4_PARTE|nr:uncharacterized protein GSPATT00001993001 [Paramecium tetraurelia]CAK78951.1 unnamed protein product [Paramecium tetraurelia]|eukprot:XP_001446348.1 hypothetical protein (macronuclear) [Paramecium tetraurelia strain d4-2]
MVLSVYSIVPVTKLSLEYNFSKGYLRVFKNPKSAKFLLLIEQLAIWKQILMLTEIYEYLEKNPFHNKETLKIYYFRHTVYQLRCLIFKLKAGLSPHMAMQIFYKKTSICLEGFALAYKQLGKKMLIVKAGFRFVRMNYKKNYYPKEIGKGSKELVYIVEEHQQYGFINYSGEVQYGELDIQITLKACSVCLIAKVDLANNIFCRHRYCEHCLKIYFRNKYSIVCPVFGCNAKLIRRLITLKNQTQKFRPSSAEREKKQPKIQDAEPNAATLLMDPNWPPKFVGSNQPNYLESQFIQLRKIIEYQCGEKQFTQDDIKNNNNLCSQCLMTLQDAQVKARCNRHYVCIQCTLNAQQTCLLC